MHLQARPEEPVSTNRGPHRPGAHRRDPLLPPGCPQATPKRNASRRAGPAAGALEKAISVSAVTLLGTLISDEVGGQGSRPAPGADPHLHVPTGEPEFICLAVDQPIVPLNQCVKSPVSQPLSRGTELASPWATCQGQPETAPPLSQTLTSRLCSRLRH